MRIILFTFLAISLLVKLQHSPGADVLGSNAKQDEPRRPSLHDPIEIDLRTGTILSAWVTENGSAKQWLFSDTQFVPRALTWKDNAPRGGFAFERLPSVTIVPLDEDSAVPGPSWSARLAVQPPFASSQERIHRFRDAAYFPLAEWDCASELRADQQLLIYEGMEIEFEPNSGKYVVRFTAGAPAMPVEVRLQLHAWDSTTDGNPANKRIGTITFPPIRIPPEDSREELTPRDYFVTHRGFSADLAGHKLGEITFTRLGTARFGFGYPTR